MRYAASSESRSVGMGFLTAARSDGRLWAGTISWGWTIVRFDDWFTIGGNNGRLPGTVAVRCCCRDTAIYFASILKKHTPVSGRPSQRYPPIPTRHPVLTRSTAVHPRIGAHAPAAPLLRALGWSEMDSSWKQPHQTRSYVVARRGWWRTRDRLVFLRQPSLQLVVVRMQRFGPANGLLSIRFSALPTVPSKMRPDSLLYAPKAHRWLGSASNRVV